MCFDARLPRGARGRSKSVRVESAQLDFPCRSRMTLRTRQAGTRACSCLLAATRSSHGLAFSGLPHFAQNLRPSRFLCAAVRTDHRPPEEPTAQVSDPLSRSSSWSVSRGRPHGRRPGAPRHRRGEPGFCPCACSFSMRAVRSTGRVSNSGDRGAQDRMTGASPHLAGAPVRRPAGRSGGRLLEAGCSLSIEIRLAVERRDRALEPG